MRISSDVASFVRDLKDFALPGAVFNPWRDHDPGLEASQEAPRQRAEQLAAYLEERRGRACFLLIAEAAGYQGCRFSGIAMTSERMMMGLHPEVRAGDIIAGGGARTSDPAKLSRPVLAKKGFNEPTATIVWKTLKHLGLGGRAWVNWNIFPAHPHRPDAPLTNRTPSPAEVTAAREFLPRFLALYPDALPVAVGNICATALAERGIAAEKVRHPANGGAGQFAEGMKALMNG